MNSRSEPRNADRSTKRYGMTVTYDGTGFAGWQVQPGKSTVQSCLEEAIARITGVSLKIHGSGRTDQGVHARKQVVHFDLDRSFTRHSLLRALNAILPPDVRVLAIRRQKPDFDARRHVRTKEYRYFIWDGPILPPFLRNYRTHSRKRLNVAGMRAAARLLVGRHDFAAFSANPNREMGSTVRSLHALTVTRTGDEVVISAKGEGFLYKMVRSLAGFLMRVGEGAVPPSEARNILESRTRTARVPTAPSNGLFLWNVRY